MARSKPAPVMLHYGSVAEMKEAAMSPYKVEGNNAYALSILSKEGRADWFGMEGGAFAVLRALTDGYPMGEAIIRGFHSRIAAALPRAEGHHRSRTRGPMGDELDVHAMMRGNFDRAWSRSTRKVKRGSGILRLVVDIGGNASTSADRLRWRGIAGLALAEVMSRAGYSVEIVAAFGVSGFTYGDEANNRAVVSCTVKPRSSSADYGLLAASVALPGFFRTLGFCSIIRAGDDQNVEVERCLGQYLDVTGVMPVPDRVAQLFVPQSVHSDETAVEFVKQSIQLLQG
jgi:hypothetical protein